jgi:hypothetical protein
MYRDGHLKKKNVCSKVMLMVFEMETLKKLCSNDFLFNEFWDQNIDNVCSKDIFKWISTNELQIILSISHF